MPDVVQATRSYEAWLARHVEVVAADISFKHEQMAVNPLAFLRGTFYRWAQLWPVVCADLAAAPRLLAVGDLHTENFGTWRDAEGRLVWGVNDFDEAFPLAYANDLVRLATSARVAIAQGELSLTPRRACTAILDGYTTALRTGGLPFVLAEEHPVLRAEAESDLRNPAAFWDRIDALPALTRPPAAARAHLIRALPSGAVPRFARRRAGVGSLGHPRIVATAIWRGGQVAREAKAEAPSACVWALHRPDEAPQAEAILRRAVRCPDPMFWPAGGWLTRRIAPDCSRIEFTTVQTRTDQVTLLDSMGRETANVHLGSGHARVASVIRDLRGRRGDWLHVAAKAMTAATLADHAAWRAARLAPRSAR